MIYIGIDPGLNGAIAKINDEGCVSIHDTPVVMTGNGNSYDIVPMLLLLPKNGRASCCAIEEVHAMPKQGVSSMFKMGYGLGIWHMAIASRRIPMRRVPPQAWKKEFNLIGKNKDASRLRAIELFPSATHLLQRKKDDGRAEALLIAEYLRRHS